MLTLNYVLDPHTHMWSDESLSISSVPISRDMTPCDGLYDLLDVSQQLADEFEDSLDNVDPEAQSMSQWRGCGHHILFWFSFISEGNQC